MQGRAYEGVKSKIARNIKVIDKVNRSKGFVSPYRSPRRKQSPKQKSTMSKSPMSAQKSTFSLVTDKSWERDCSNQREEVKTPKEFA